MIKTNYCNKLMIVLTIILFSISLNGLNAQYLFSINQNGVSAENVSKLKTQISNFEISTLSLTRNYENKEFYHFPYTDALNSKIIILNQETGNNVLITPFETTITEFRIAPFFVEELKQSVLGEAGSYLVIETDSELSAKNVVSIAVPAEEAFIPRYLYGPKENIKEAFPKERQIIKIFKDKPSFFHVYNDPEGLNYIAQLEEEMSYYVYMYRLPDGTLCTYSEHFNIEEKTDETRTGNHLPFNLSGNLTGQPLSATLYAFDLWSEHLGGTVPVDINIRHIDLGSSSVIGRSFRTPNYLIDDTYYPTPLANQLLGYNFAPNQRDIRLEMNSTMNFYYDPDGTPANYQIDWITVMLHELTHGFGFYSLLNWDGISSPYSGLFVFMDVNGQFYNTEYPGIYDRFLFQGTTGPCITELTPSERAALMVSNNLFSGAPGSYLLEANGGSRVKMFAPAGYMPGSSISHWDTSVSFPTFMKYAYQYKFHTISTRKIGIMLDMGWKVPQTNPYKSVKNLTAEIIANNAVITWEEPDPLNIEDFEGLLEGYIIYRFITGQTEENWTLLSDNITDTDYTDTEWDSLISNIYQYAVIAKYSGNNFSDEELSNTLQNKMNVNYRINISTNIGEPATGALITLTNQNGLQQYVYTATSDETGATVENVWKGIYNLTITLQGFQDYVVTDLEISYEKPSHNAELLESLAPPLKLKAEIIDENTIISWIAPHQYELKSYILDDGTYEDSFVFGPNIGNSIGNQFNVNADGEIVSIDVFGVGAITSNRTVYVDIYNEDKKLAGSSAPFILPQNEWINVQLDNIPYSGTFYAMVRWSQASGSTNRLGFDKNGPNVNEGLCWFKSSADAWSLFQAGGPGVFMIRANAMEYNKSVSYGSINTSNQRDLLGYMVYRLIKNQPETSWLLLFITISDNTFTDTKWNTLPDATYQYAVKALYTSGISVAKLSNLLIKGLGSVEKNIIEQNISVYGKANQVHIINNNNIHLKLIQIVDMLGRVIYNGDAETSTVIDVNAATGHYIVKIVSADGLVLNTKIYLWR